MKELNKIIKEHKETEAQRLERTDLTNKIANEVSDSIAEILEKYDDESENTIRTAVTIGFLNFVGFMVETDKEFLKFIIENEQDQDMKQMLIGVNESVSENNLILKRNIIKYLNTSYQVEIGKEGEDN